MGGDHVRVGANMAESIRDALTNYASDVRAGAYPETEHTYAMPEDELELFSETVLADGNSVDRSFQTDARAKPARPEAGTASGASAQRVEQAHADG